MASLVWFVSGCSSGFGEVLVQRILARGDKVIATARRLDSITHLQEAGAHIMELDVTHDAGTLEKASAGAISVYGRVDVLVNNAGYVVTGAWEDVEPQQLREQFETNVFGVFKLTRAFLPHFRRNRSGTIVFISSLSGWHGNSFTGPYCGSKFALEGLVESLSEETEGLGIKSLLIEPGMFRTNLLSPSNRVSGRSRIADYSEKSKEVMDMYEKSDRNQAGDPQKAAEVILDLVRGEGHAEGKEVPLRVPLGTDSYNTLKSKCEATLKLLEEWKPIITSTDY